MKTVPLATFNARAPAHDLQQRLRAAGFQAVIEDESKLERFWFMSEPLAAIHVRVNKADYLAAQRWLDQLNTADATLTQAVRCPECGSRRVEFPQITRKFFMPIAEAVLMALHLLPRKFYCPDCYCTWPKQPPAEPEPERDELGWPRQSGLWHPEKARRGSPGDSQK